MDRLTHERNSGIKMGYWSPAKKEDLVQHLAAYEDTGLTPGQLREIDQLYLDKCREVTELKKRLEWVPVGEQLPDKPGDYWVAMRHLDGSVTTVKMYWRPDWPHEDAWREVVVAWQPYYCPEPYRPEG